MAEELPLYSQVDVEAHTDEETLPRASMPSGFKGVVRVVVCVCVGVFQRVVSGLGGALALFSVFSFLSF